MPGAVPCCGGDVIGVTAVENDTLRTFGTVRGRVGVTITAPLLAYITGGLAYGQVSHATNFSETFTGACFCGPNPAASAVTSRFQAGWTVGGGLEWLLTQHWSVKGEYLYYDLGGVSGATQLTQLNAAGVNFFGGNIATTSAFRGNIARAGLNYRF
jgi:outer membrane immunogenic protein